MQVRFIGDDGGRGGRESTPTGAATEGVISLGTTGAEVDGNQHRRGSISAGANIDGSRY